MGKRDRPGLAYRQIFAPDVALLLFLQMMGSFLPLVFFPDETWTRYRYAPWLEGQYITKNLVLLGAGIVVGATVRGGSIIAEPARRTQSP